LLERVKGHGVQTSKERNFSPSWHQPPLWVQRPLMLRGAHTPGMLVGFEHGKEGEYRH
jgi:hypothetical protein